MVRYLQNKFILVDHVQVITPQRLDYAVLDKNFLENANQAIVFPGDKEIQRMSTDPHPLAQAMRIDASNDYFQVLSFNADRVRLTIDVPYTKFLIYNDNYDARWKVTINGKSVPLLQTNVSFKGVWLPAGKSIVDFHYGDLGQYLLNVGLLVLSFVILAGMILFYKEEK